MKNIYKKLQNNTIFLWFRIVLLTLCTVTGYAQINTVLNTQIKGEITADAGGSDLGTYTISLNKPAGATTINTIFVYNTAYSSDYGANAITLNGVTTPLNTLTSANPGILYYCRYSNVTSTSTALVNTLNAAAAGSNTTIVVTESNYGGIDGVGILVLWNIPTNPMGTFVIQLGCLATGPTPASSSFTVAPIDKTLSGFKATMGCGIGFSTGANGQTSVLSIGAAFPTTIVSSNVGGVDDGTGDFTNGTLITLGGTGDSPTANDADELFDVAPFLSNGQTQISYNLLDINSAYDDYINVLYFSGTGVLPPCNAGTTAPTLSATTKANVCPTTTVDLTSITASNLPASTILTWHTGTPATTANKVATPTAVAAGTYYAAFFDATNNCYSGTSGSATTAVTATVASCSTPVTVGTPAVITGTTGTPVTGNPPTGVSGGTSPYTYSDGTGDALCTAPTAPTLALPTGRIIGLVGTTGAHSINTTGLGAGTYQYCIKVCDNTGTNCAISKHTIVVTAACNAGSAAPSLIKN